MAFCVAKGRLLPCKTWRFMTLKAVFHKATGHTLFFDTPCAGSPSHLMMRPIILRLALATADVSMVDRYICVVFRLSCPSPRLTIDRS